jgi:ubiquinone biosynthesis protein COQ4
VPARRRARPRGVGAAAREQPGRAYLAHIERHGLDPTKLVELGRTHGPSAQLRDPDLRWWRERGEVAHDLWHVLAGYGADPLGEAALLPFSLAQTGGRANALLALGATLEAARRDGVRAFARAWRAWRRGRRAVRLAWLRYEELLPLPLDEARARCRIEPLTP